jgi:hypothetical protein
MRTLEKKDAPAVLAMLGMKGGKEESVWLI